MSRDSDSVEEVWSLVVTDDESLDLVVDELGKVGVDDHIAVTMADDQTIAVGYCQSRYVVALLMGDGGCFKRPQMKEHHDFGRGDKLDDELAEDRRDSRAILIEEDTKAFDGANASATVCRGKLHGAVLLLHKMRSWEAVYGFRGPLLLFAKPPEDEERGEDAGECQGKPSSVGNFDQGC